MADSPKTPHEVGTLSTVSGGGESQFLGSSSGIYFVNTVQRAFAISTRPSSPTAGERTQGIISANPTKNSDGYVGFQGSDLSDTLGCLPDLPKTRELIMDYFKLWHPILPFLHGPTFLKDVEAFYEEQAFKVRPPGHTSQARIKILTFQCILNTAAVNSDTVVPAKCQVRSVQGLLTVVGSIMEKHSIKSLQAILAAQLYLIATMSLKAASVVGGILVKAIFHTGYHRCPARYSQISSSEREMRKRIFWCSYGIDRYLSQALGTPLVLQDSDIDVCRPGQTEIHGSVCDISGQNSRDDAFANLIDFMRILGDLIELFHKSIHSRKYDQARILNLTSDFHEWWNNLPSELQDGPNSGNEMTAAAGAFFSILFQTSILLLNRPFLSLDTKTPEFRSSLQACIGASRSIISSLAAQKQKRATVFWPGFLSATWMSGLIIAYACELGLYPVRKAYIEIETCLELLDQMSVKWNTAKECGATLRIMLSGLQQQKNKAVSMISHPISNKKRITAQPPKGDSDEEASAKRPRTEVHRGELSTASSGVATFSQTPVAGSSYESSMPYTDHYSQDSLGLFGLDQEGSGQSQDLFGYLSWESMFSDGGMNNWGLQ